MCWCNDDDDDIFPFSFMMLDSFTFSLLNLIRPAKDLHVQVVLSKDLLDFIYFFMIGSVCYFINFSFYLY